MPLDEVAEREFPGENRVDVVTRDELEIVDDRDVARIGHRDGERATVAFERQDQMLRREIARDELDDPRIHLESREVDRRHTVLSRDELRELVLVDVPQLDQTVAEPVAALRLLLQGARELLLRDGSFADEDLADSIVYRYRGCHVRRCAREVGVETR